MKAKEKLENNLRNKVKNKNYENTLSEGRLNPKRLH